MPKKKVVKAAKKALNEARSAVSEAEKAVRKLDRQSRREAGDLRRDLEAVEKSARKSAERDSRSTRKTDRPAPASRPAPEAKSEPEARSAADAPAAPSFRELRARAKEKGVRGYSRMDKTALQAALQQS